MAQLGNQRIAWFNGQFMPENQVMIPFRDRNWYRRRSATCCPA
ncbi:MAG: hypothetical protein U1E60_02570 [Reyranellaceae bacterium]